MPSSRTTTGLPPGVLAGATGPRLLSALIEVGPVWLLGGLALLFALVFDGPLLVVVLCLLLAVGWGILVWAQRAQRAAGPGMRLGNLQVVGMSDGRPLGWSRVLLDPLAPDEARLLRRCAHQVEAVLAAARAADGAR